MSRLLLAAAGGLVVLAVAAGGLVWFSQQAPPPAAGTTRLTYRDRGLPPPYEVVRAPDGRGVSLSFGGLDAKGASLGAQKWPSGNGSAVTLLHLREGQSQAVDGVVVHVAHVWRTPNPANEAVDVTVS